MSLINDLDLAELILGADQEDLAILADFITDNGEGRISLSSSVCNRLHLASQTQKFTEEVRGLLVEEMQRFGGNSLANLFRQGAGVSYREILCDVADHLKVPYQANSPCEQIEMAILFKILEKSLDTMSEEQKRELFKEFGGHYTAAGPAAMAALISVIRLSGFGTYKMAAIVANAVAKTFIGRGLTFASSGALMRGISVLAGPIGWALTAAWTFFDLASPAYRVTVPCVVQIAYMRQKAMVTACPTCQAVVTAGSRFCSQCGTPVAARPELP